ncbi:unnamed protein product [Arctogadus glacialis]
MATSSRGAGTKDTRAALVSSRYDLLHVDNNRLKPSRLPWHLCHFQDSDGVCGSSHLLNITLTMHRLLMSSSDLMDKLTTLYP